VEQRLHSLHAIASQAAVAVGTTMLCIDRAQRLAVQEERVRIARDIHDTVSQSLFGIVFTLNGCLKLLPGDVEAVIPELERVQRVAEEARLEVRRSIMDIWPSEITSTQFVVDLRKYTSQVCQAEDLPIHFDVNGDMTCLSSRARRSMYRIAQEALANIARHAGATEARVSLEVDGQRARLEVLDNGHGFDPERAQAREVDREHFGLRGMQARAASLGGDCQIDSRPGGGTTIVVDIPVSAGV